MRSKLCVVAAEVLVLLLVAGGVLAQSPAGEAVGVPAEGSGQSEAGVYPFDPAEVVARSSASISLAGQRIDVAVTDDNEVYPAVALCASNQYLVVYQYYDDSTAGPDAIYGQRLTSGGALLGGPFRINTGDAEGAFWPDVACEWSQNRFVVVWEYDWAGDLSDLDVRAQVVHGAHQTSGSSQLVGSWLWVSQLAPDAENTPAIACNSDDATCLVVYRYWKQGQSHDIHGQRLRITAGEPYRDGDPFVVSDHTDSELAPDVAWGPLDENYLVAWEMYRSTAPAYDRIVFTHVHDTVQAPGDELQHATTGLINLVDWPHPQTNPAVAYNPFCGDDGRYLVTFDYELSASDVDIGARRIWGTSNFAEGPPFLVASTGSADFYSHVAASGRFDQFLVTYVTQVHDASTWYYALHGRVIKGTHDDGGGGQLQGPAFEIYQTPHAEGWSMGPNDVAGSLNNASYLAVWNDRTTGAGFDVDVYGQLLVPPVVYLPCVVRNY
ncbi:hypothetical protein ACFLT5_01775 [Chloroflexota bacterium]